MFLPVDYSKQYHFGLYSRTFLIQGDVMLVFFYNALFEKIQKMLP